MFVVNFILYACVCNFTHVLHLHVYTSGLMPRVFFVYWNVQHMHAVQVVGDLYHILLDIHIRSVNASCT